jgi:hypothetical protein
MALRTYNARDCRLLDALFSLIASCASFVAEKSAWADQALTGVQRRRLASARRDLEALGLVARIIARRPWREERSSIRCGRSQNIEPAYAKPIPITDGEEQALTKDL